METNFSILIMVIKHYNTTDYGESAVL